MKGDKVVAVCDRNRTVISPILSAPGNRNESPRLQEALRQLTCMAQAMGLDLRGSIVRVDGGYDCPLNRKTIFNRGMTLNIDNNPRGRTTTKRDRKQIFDDDISEERYYTVERVIAWEHKFKRLLLRFDCVSEDTMDASLPAGKEVDAPRPDFARPRHRDAEQFSPEKSLNPASQRPTLSLFYFSPASPISFYLGTRNQLHNKVKVTMRKSYGFRTFFRITEIALCHRPGKLPEPDLAHRFY